MSLQTTMARAAARDAETAWRRHRAGCVTCTAAAKARRWDRLCDPGFVAYDDLRVARADVEQSRQADSRPIAGQLPLL